MPAILICQLTPVTVEGTAANNGYVADADKCAILVWQSIEALFSTI